MLIIKISLIINIMFDIIKINLKTKKVKFNKIVKVILIPSLKNVSFKNELWWSEIDMYNAEYTSFKELNKLILRHRGLDFKLAKKILYQPLSYDKDNFIYN